MSRPTQIARAPRLGPARYEIPRVPPPGGGGNPQLPNFAPPSIPITGRRIFTRPTVPVASFIDATLTIVEGRSAFVRARLSQPNNLVPMAMPISVNSASTVASGAYTAPTEFQWAPGETVAIVEVPFGLTAAAGSSRILYLELNPNLEPSDPTFEVPRIDTTIGSIVVAITVTDAVTVGTPAYSFGAVSEVTVNEGETRTFTLGLSRAAVDEVRIRVQTVNVSATANVDYVPLDEVLVYAVGDTERSFDVRFPQNTVDVTGTPQIEVTATLVSGTAEEGATPTVTVNILDDDNLAATPTLRWVTPSQTIFEGETIRMRARLENSQGTPVGATETLFVPITTAAPAGLGDWRIIFPSLAGSMRFEAGQSESYVDVECRIDGDTDPGETLTITLGGAPAGEWQVLGGGGASRVLTSAELGSELTQLFAPGAMETSDDVRVVRQYPIALPSDVSPSSLPTYEHAGEIAQLVGQRLTKGAQYRTGYVYAMDDGAISIPYKAGSKTVGVASGTATMPPESGDFVAIPAIRLIVGVQTGATVTEYSMATSLNATDAAAVDYKFTAPDGFFPQVGADLVRDNLFWGRLRKAGVTGLNSQSAPSGDWMWPTEINVQRFAGEKDILSLEIRNVHAWSSNADPTAVNPICDGTLNIRWIKLQAPTGWRVEVFDAHQRQARDGSLDNSFFLLTDSGDVETIDAGFGNFMWAIVRRVDGTEAAGSATRALHYWEQKHICEVVGALGGQRKGLRNETGDLMVDWYRFGYVDSRTGLEGYEGIDALGRDRMYGWGPGPANRGYRADWVSGAGMPNNRARLGWAQPAYGALGYESGGEGIAGTHDVCGHFSDWYRDRATLAGCMQRCNYHFRALNGDLAPWWFLKTQLESGEYRMSWQGSPDYQMHANAHPHMYGGHIPATQLAAGLDVTPYRLAPTNRPWHTVPAGLEDPNLSTRRTWDPWPMTHVSRYRRSLLGNWIFRRSPIALRTWEEVAAAATTAYPAMRPINALQNNFASYNSNPAEIYARLLATPNYVERLNRGYWTSYSNRGHSNVVARNLGWVLCLTSGLHSLGTDTMREALRATSGAAVARGARSFFAVINDWLSAVATPSGILFGVVKDDDAIDFSSWDEGACGQTNFGARSGALPKPSNVGSPGKVMRGMKLMFAIYASRGVFAMLDMVPLGSGVFPSAPLEAATSWGVRQRIGMEDRQLSVTKRTTQIVPCAYHDAQGVQYADIFPPGAAANMPVLSETEFADVGAWPQIQTYSESGSVQINGDRAWLTFSKYMAWMGETAARYLNDPAGWELGLFVRDTLRPTYEESIAGVRAGVVQGLAGTPSGEEYRRYTSDAESDSYLLASYAALMNTYS